MGQQQLLLIVLGVIIVGIAVTVGISIFNASAVQSNRESVISDLTAIASMAQEYYRKPTALAGGGYSFTGFTIPRPLRNNENGRYSITVRVQRITLVGRGVEIGNNGRAVVRVTMNVDPYSITSVRINN